MIQDNVAGKSYGVLVMDTDDKEQICNLILKNTAVPVEVTQSFRTHVENQDTIEIKIMQNEAGEQKIATDQTQALQIGSAVLDLPARLPVNAPFDVTFKLNDLGFLEMTVVEWKESRTASVTIETGSII